MKKRKKLSEAKQEKRKKNSAQQTRHIKKKRDSMIKKRPEIYYPYIVLCQKKKTPFLWQIVKMFIGFTSHLSLEKKHFKNLDTLTA